MLANLILVLHFVDKQTGPATLVLLSDKSALLLHFRHLRHISLKNNPTTNKKVYFLRRANQVRLDVVLGQQRIFQFAEPWFQLVFVAQVAPRLLRDVHFPDRVKSLRYTFAQKRVREF